MCKGSSRECAVGCIKRDIEIDGRLSIAAIFGTTPLGIASTIFTVLSKNEFG